MKVERLSHSKFLKMKVNVYQAFATVTFIWMDGFREESIITPNSLAELTNRKRIGVPLSSEFRRWVGGDLLICSSRFYDAFGRKQCFLAQASLGKSSA